MSYLMSSPNKSRERRLYSVIFLISITLTMLIKVLLFSVPVLNYEFMIFLNSVHH